MAGWFEDVDRAFVQVLDNVLPDPMAYRRAALGAEFKSIAIGQAVFHGIGRNGDFSLPRWIEGQYPTLQSGVTFFRQSPLGQQEPNFIHTDLDMGEWTGILYLTPDPPAEDGTTFWRHRQTGEIGSVALTDEARLEEWFEWREPDKWEPWHRVQAVFNRLMLFPARYFHSRSIAANYGDGDDARLIQIVFGTGELPSHEDKMSCQ
jgi:hypothetical protein